MIAAHIVVLVCLGVIWCVKLKQLGEIVTVKRCYSCGTTYNVFLKRNVVVNIDVLVQFAKPRTICKRCIESLRAEVEILTEEVHTND